MEKLLFQQRNDAVVTKHLVDELRWVWLWTVLHHHRQAGTMTSLRSLHYFHLNFLFTFYGQRTNS